MEGVDFLDWEKRHVLLPWAKQSKDRQPRAVVWAERCRFRDHEGREYLDFGSQLTNVNAGHQHPRIVQAICDQAARLCYANPAFCTEPRARLAHRLAEVTPAGLDHILFSSSGALANENALKMARAFTGRSKVLARRLSYHGGSYATASVGGDLRGLGAQPAVPGRVRVWDPLCYRCFFRMKYPECGLYCANAIREVIESEGPETIAAFIVEPISGTNCSVVPPPGYLDRLRMLCDEYGIVLIFDEVMTGFGRTGHWFAADLFGVTPDIMTLSKGLDGGTLPIGATVVNDRIGRFFEEHFLYAGETQTANPIACAAGAEAIAVYRDEGLVENARRMGERLVRGLQDLAARHSVVGEVRGHGLFHGMDLVRDRESREPIVPWTHKWVTTPHPEMAALLSDLMEHGFYATARWSVLLISPPLCINEAEIDEGLAILDGALVRMERRLAAGQI